MLNDLCLVSDVRTVLGLQSGTDVALVQRYVTAASALFENETNRVYRPTLYTERRNGTGTEILVLKRYPFIQWDDLQVEGVTVDMSKIYVDKHTVYSTGFFWPRGIQNILLKYWAGFGAEVAENATVASGEVIVSFADWFYLNVKVMDGSTTMTKVSANPAAGQYTVDDTGKYTFNSADNGKVVTISYWYKDIPADLQQAIIEIACSRYRRKSHIDQDSQNTGGQNIQFTKADVPPEVKEQFENYRMRGMVIL